MRWVVVIIGAALFILVQVELVWLFRANQRAEAARNAPVEGLSPGAGAKSWPIIDPDHPCGPVVLVLTGHLLDQPLTLSEADTLLQPDALGRVSMAELVEGFRKLGLSPQGVRLDPETCHQLALPFVIYQGGNHFAVAVPKDASSVVLLNPPFQPEALTTEELQQRGWTGEGIVVGKDAAHLEKLLARVDLSAS